MGIGGLHSCEKAQLLKAGEGLLFELDCQGYYPNIILQQKLHPKSMGIEFLNVYQSIVEQRNTAKAEMQRIENKIKLLDEELKTM
jgi:hypothetical protein